LLKRKLFDHLQTLDFSYYNTTPVGTIMARLMSDTGKIGTVLAWSLVDIFWSSMYVLGCVVILLFVNWKLALILIAII
ncbi:ABC transporter transmembrane domain-containing protein, partial [Terrisporobacter mayombei]|uniref:ABC transporter transmembrane domain-containing protein n=1 Tax=Terrisporobacter mayombei TaxID=1541 RepID=UPI00265AFCB9